VTDYTICGKRGLPIDANNPFDNQAARNSIFSWAGWPNSPDPAKARQGFVLVTTGADPKLKGSYHVPFARVVGGALKAVPNGVRNGKSRLPQVKGVSADVVKRGQAFLQSYIDRIHAQNDGRWPETLGEPTEDDRVALATPLDPDADPDGDLLPPDDNDDDRLLWVSPDALRIQPSSITDARRAELVQKIKDDHALVPSSIDENPPFIVDGVVSDDTRDTYYTRMHPTSLRNYAADAEAGAPLQDSHLDAYLPIGRSIAGRFIAGNKNRPARTEATIYIIPGLQLGKVPNDQVIKGISTGTSRALSIGFTGGWLRCVICGRDYRRDCPHFLGRFYVVNDQDLAGNSNAVYSRGQEVQAEAWVMDAHMAEISLVFAASNRSAALYKALEAARSGSLGDDDRYALESLYRMRLPRPARQFPVKGATSWRHVDSDGAGAPKEKGSVEEISISESAYRALTRLVPGDDLRGTETPEEAVALIAGRMAERAKRLHALELDLQSQKDRIAALEGASAELERIRPLAERGKQWHDQLVKDALKAGRRAIGEKFDEKRYAELLSHAEPDAIVQFTEDWARLSGETFGDGRRSVRDLDAERELRANRGDGGRGAPASAYAVR
jgi:hypothetical protein